MRVLAVALVALIACSVLLLDTAAASPDPTRPCSWPRGGQIPLSIAWVTPLTADPLSFVFTCASDLTG
jgi:hypothetical protein